MEDSCLEDRGRVELEGERGMQVPTGTQTREGKTKTMERERKAGERRRETEKREENIKAEGEGTREGVEGKVSRKGERRRRRWRRRQQHTKTRERGEEGRDRREEGRCTAQKLEGGSVPSDIMTGGAQGSDERATGRRGRGRMEGRRVRRDEGEEKKSLVRDRTDKRGKCVRWGRKRKISVVPPHHPARAEWSTVCVGWATGGRVRDGQPSSPFKKKKEEGICNSSLIKIIFRPIIYWTNERGSKRGAPLIFSPFLWCCAYLPPFWAPTETRPRS